MSAGCIPVVLLRGGVQDIVTQGVNGFLGTDVEKLANYTLQVFNMSPQQAATMRSQAIRDVARFSHTAFAKRFKAMAQRAAQAKPFRHLVNDTQDVVNSRTFVVPEGSANTAIIVQTDRHYALEYVAKSALYHLSSSAALDSSGDAQPWSLLVVHLPSNRAFVQKALAGISGVQLLESPEPRKTLSGSHFWQHLVAERVLLLSTSSLLLRGGLAPFLPFDYVAPPACTPSGSSGGSGALASAALPALLAPAAPPQYGELFGDGFGELSLYSVQAMRVLTAQLEESREMGIELRPEQIADLLLTTVLDADGGGGFETAPPELAYQFAVAAPCPALERNHTARYGSFLHTLPHVPAGLQATWQHFWGDNQRYRDLLKLLGVSVCGHL